MVLVTGHLRYFSAFTLSSLSGVPAARACMDFPTASFTDPALSHYRYVSAHPGKEKGQLSAGNVPGKDHLYQLAVPDGFVPDGHAMGDDGKTIK